MKSPDAMTREELEEEVAYLRGELGLATAANAVARIKAAMGLEDGSARVLLSLHAAKGRPLTKWQILEAIPAQRVSHDRDPKLVDVWVNRIRKATSKDMILTVWGQGHAITPVGIAKVDKALEGAGVVL